MKNKKMVWILVAAFVLLLVGASALYKGFSEEFAPQQLAVQEQPGETVTVPAGEDGTMPTDETEPVLAPDFTVYDLEGNAWSLSDFRGKPVILNFWASWCGPCKMEMPEFEEAYGEYGDQIHFLLVNLTDGAQETVETASSFVAGEGYTFPIYYDTDMSAAMAYAVNAVPVTYFIDENGGPVAYISGATDLETLKIGIDMILPTQ